ncbi:MAG TPA: excinuclease ABC subunit UvrA [Candidatus Dojkabacteria bacterium]|nr:excinuclease ABC subunit UvrA [Candidatus Dojkabacteria bacterium]
MKQEYIKIKGARENNLKNISVDIPKNKLVVFTGVSGSGKSTLAFDTLYAEGQRRYVESLSSYARQFLGVMKKPDVDSITGLSPAISIDQKTTGTNPRSTVGTITEIYNHLRLLYGHIGQPHCPKCGSPIQSQTIQQITNKVIKEISNTSEVTQIVSPIIKNRKGEFTALLNKLLSKGFLRVIIDGNTYLLDDIEDIKLEENNKHTIDLVIDRIDSTKLDKKRLTDAIELAITQSNGEVKVLLKDKELFFSENNTCPKCEISYPKITPASFSFNAPEGACPKCAGLGVLKEIDINLIYNPILTILEGGIFPWSNRTSKDSWTLRILREIAKEHGFNLTTPIGRYPKEIFDLIFYGNGTKDAYTIEYTNRFGRTRLYEAKYEGVIPELERRYRETSSDYARFETEKYMRENICPVCEGKRLKPYSLAVTIGGKNIDEITNMPTKDVLTFFKTLELKGSKKDIAEPIIKEINQRLNFLENVGLNYLSLSRKANTLSGGESQRIRLASQIGTGLSGVLYVLDEPSIGLHQRDISKLITSLKDLRDAGNSIIVVEHDEEMTKSADWILDIGPFAGKHGGSIVAKGTLDDIKHSDSLTAKYLNKILSVGQNIPQSIINTDGKKISLKGIKTHNLKNLDLTIPLNQLICITGVSGSGKSSLIADTLYPVLANKISRSQLQEGNYDSIEGLEHINQVINIDQSPIGRTPRSNPATYTGVFTQIREIFAQTNEAQARGYKAGRFSFNAKGGRCEKCRGDGVLKIEMQFLPDMYITCDECNGSRYNEEALQIDFKGKNISDILKMTVEEALEFFKNIPSIHRKLSVLNEVGLGYIELGQSALTLSGGESQRVKLSKELSKISRGHTLYILDEPTTGLHYHDVDKLLVILRNLVKKGHTVIIVEHNMDIVRHSDWIIDLGPEGGDQGGYIIAQGPVSDIIKSKTSWTGKYLKKYISETSGQ